MELDKIGLKFLLGKIVTCDNLSHFSPYFFFLDKVYENLETVRSYSDKRGTENKQKKSAFLLISASKDSLCLSIQTLFFMKQQLHFYKSLKF